MKRRDYLSGFRAETGYSLIELLVAMMVMMIVMAAIYGIWGGLARSYTFTEDDIRAQNDARTALGEVIEYVRTGRQPDSSLIPSGSEYLETVIPKAGPYELWVWTDIDRDASHDLELVRFALQPQGGEHYLVRQESPGGDGNFSGAPVRIIDNNVRNLADGEPVFVYIDKNGQELVPPSLAAGSFISSPTAIREVRVDLSVDIDPTRQPFAHEISSVVQPRNLRQY